MERAFFTKACSDRTKGKGFKLKEGTLGLDMKKFFAVRVVGHWNRLPRELVGYPIPGSVQSQAEWDIEQPLYPALLLKNGNKMRSKMQLKSRHKHLLSAALQKELRSKNNIP